uniref:CHAT domain-containing protein n=1 Tax=Trichocoleus desertorum TaxID=1481672 RepID=UPI0025B4038D|nr:CHAT domain-containing protein [Trichocoleus desertorum]
MDEQRLQAYVALIKQLLEYPQGEEATLLQAHSDLLDEGLLATMEQVATHLESEGRGNAQWLRGLAAQLAEAMGLQQVTPQGADAARQFLLETLQLIWDKRGNPQQIYPLWTQQQTGFNAELLAVLPSVAAQLLQENTEQRTFIAAILGEFGNLIQQFPLGARWLNLELGIATYQQVLQMITHEAMPIDWAAAMNNLATAYCDRIRGDRAQNLELSIAVHQQVLQVRTREAMPIDWATSMHNLATAYYFRIRGDRAQNIEDAIAAYQQVLQVMTREAMPVDWAESMMNLAIAYYFRIRGDRAQNIEDAIAAHEQALQVRTREAMPVDWATSMHNLATAYSKRIRGDRAQNIEDAIAAYQQALQVRTREAMPVDWATSMHNLANTYCNRIRGDRAQNIEDAIAAYQQALQVRAREAMPVQWAGSIHNLANTYCNRIRGDRAQNLELGIAAHQQALQVRTREAMPIDWAESMHNLATAYSKRIRGDRAQNIEDAIAAYQQALQVRTREAMPVDWATSMHNLAIAYYSRIRGDRAQNIEDAIAAHEQALQVRTREAMPVDWATSMHNLANTYCNRIRGDRAQNLELGIAAHQQALQVRTREAMPIDWAESMINLATAYSKRIGGDRAQNIEDAIAAYRNSLEIFTPELLPDGCRRTARSLGNLYFGETRWKEAVSVYQIALQAAETLYQSANLLDSKAAELSETADLPRRAAYALGRSGEFQQAIEILERGRARGLSESLNRDRADLTQLQQTHPDLYQDYQTIANQLRNLESQQRNRMTSTERHSLTPGALRDSAIALRQQLDTLIQSIRQIPGYEKFLSLPTFDDVCCAVKIDCPLVYLVPTSAGSLALIVMIDNIEPVWLNHLPESKLREILYGPADNPKLSRWFGAHQDFRNDAKANYLAWCEEIDRSTCQLWEPLMQPLIQHLKEHQFHQATLIPTGLLSFLPLHAAWIEHPTRPTGRRYALDDIHFTYAPNARSLTAARAITPRSPAESILAINNPRQDLPNSKREVEAAIATFPQSTVLKHGDATVEAVKKALVGVATVHFSCHGTANLTDPLNSGLLMSDGLLTLRDIFVLNLADQGGLRLAILSACETGLSGIKNADEAVSLPTGLLQAGVAAVIASLWSVSDLSTMLLLTKFYDLWRSEKPLPPDQALRQAQIWLRDTTNEEKIAEFKAFIPAFAGTRLSPTTAQELYNELAWEAKNERSFAHPFHWAAFTYTGV